MADKGDLRAMADGEARGLRPGSDHYTAYVGPPGQYDLMGASQFRLLCALGLRDHHRVLDFGCGSLRLGRLLIPYLTPNRYFGIEPNTWLIEDAIDRQLGRDILSLKSPRFSDSDRFDATVFGETFDFIVAQSIFSHTGRDLIRETLKSFRAALAPGGLVLCTLIHVTPGGQFPNEFTGSGWIYPGCVAFHRSTIQTMIAEAGLSGLELPWFHPRQSWYALAHQPSDLPAVAKFAHLSGGVLRDPEQAAST